MSDDDKIPECDDCTDDGGMCDRLHLDSGACSPSGLRRALKVLRYVTSVARVSSELSMT